MECPFCVETIKDESIVCKNCSRDLRVVRPVILEIQELASELDRLQRELDRVEASLVRIRSPFRHFFTHAAAYVLAPIVLLVAAHIILVIRLDVAPINLRLASVIIPLPFGLALYARRKIGFGGALLVGIVTAALAVTCMLAVTGFVDNVPILPGPWIEWREVIEYVTSIALAFATGNLVGFLIFDVLPNLMTGGGKPNAFAYRIAKMLGEHVGEEHLRRRARNVQGLMTTVGPLIGVAATLGGSIYTGLKSIFGW